MYKKAIGAELRQGSTLWKRRPEWMCGYAINPSRPPQQTIHCLKNGHGTQDQLWKATTILKGLLSVTHHVRIRRLKTARSLLDEALCHAKIGSLDGLEQLMREISKLLPHAEDLDKCMYTLGDIAGITVALALSQLGKMPAKDEQASRASKRIVAKFIRQPLKFAQKRAGCAHLCFPVIYAIAKAYADWNCMEGGHQAVRLCLETTKRIMQQDKLILKGKEGFGVFGTCLSVLGEDVGLDLLEELLDWAINAIQKSTVWESRYWAIGFLKSLSEVPFGPFDDIAIIVRERERLIHQVLRTAQMDSNLKVREVAEDVYDSYRRLWTRYIPTASPQDPPHDVSSDGNKLTPITEDFVDMDSDLPCEFYANLYRGNVDKPSEDPRKPNAWDIKALEKHHIWDVDPMFDPYAYDWTNWKWPIENDLGRFAEALRTGGGVAQELHHQDYDDDQSMAVGCDLPCGSSCAFFAGDIAL